MRVSRLVRRALTRGLIGPGWYGVLTGLAMLFVASMPVSVSGDVDPAARVVALVLVGLGVWQVGTGVRLVRARSRPS